jgi:hypothetical protein
VRARRDEAHRVHAESGVTSKTYRVISANGFGVEKAEAYLRDIQRAASLRLLDPVEGDPHAVLNPGAGRCLSDPTAPSPRATS